MPIVVDTRRPAGMQSRSYRSRKSRGRISRRRTRFKKRKTPLALKQHNFVERGVTEGVITINTEASSTMFGETFALSKVQQSAEYKTLFEMYRIDKVVVTFRYKGGNATVGATSTSVRNWNEVNPVLYFKVDHDDITTQTVGVMKESSKTREHQFSNDKPNFSITLKPAIQAEAYKTSLTSAYIPKWGQWLRTVDDTVPHYGLKAHAIAFKDSSWNPGTLTVEYKYYISFKNNQ